MKYLNLILAAVLIGIVAVDAAQTTALTQRDVRDPVKLESILEANALDVETRVAAVEGGTATVTLGANKLLVGNDASNQTAMAVTGDVTITQDGTNVITAIAAGVVVNPNGTNLLTEGYFDVANTTQLVFIAAGVTNVIDADITTP